MKGEPYEPRRVVVVIGDGHDTASKKTLKEVIEIAQRNLVTVYAMSTVAFGFHTESEDNLAQLTAQTGGKVETPLNDVYKDVSGYLSTPSDAGNYAHRRWARAAIRRRFRARFSVRSPICQAKSPRST